MHGGINLGEVLKDNESVDVWWDLIESTLKKAKDFFIPKKKFFNKPSDKHMALFTFCPCFVDIDPVTN